MGAASRVQIRDEADFISHSIDVFGKDMNTIILPPPMDK